MFPIGLNTLATSVLYDEESSALWGVTGRSSLMDTQAWLNKEDGHILGITTTRNLNWVFGFTGAVGLLVFDFNGAPILRTETQAFGVDARGLFLKPSSRTDSWELYIDVTAAQSAGAIKIAHTTAPRQRLDEILDEIVRTKEKLEDAAKKFPEVFR
jgi:hypothetical protein